MDHTYLQDGIIILRKEKEFTINNTLFVESKVMLKRNGKDLEMVTNESWSLKDNGKILSLKQYSRSFWDERKITMIYDKK